MGMILAADDIDPDTLVTVYDVRGERAGWDVEDVIVRSRQSRPCALQPGVPMRVLDVSLPFVACAVIRPGGDEVGPVILDLRTVCLARLQPAFVDAIRRFSVPGRDADESTAGQTKGGALDA